MAAIKAKKQHIKPTKLEKKERRIALAFVAPLFIGFIIFTMICMVISVIQSFTDYNPISGDMNFVGIQNYVDLFIVARDESLLLFYFSLYYIYNYITLNDFLIVLK